MKSSSKASSRQHRQQSRSLNTPVAFNVTNSAYSSDEESTLSSHATHEDSDAFTDPRIATAATTTRQTFQSTSNTRNSSTRRELRERGPPEDVGKLRREVEVGRRTNHQLSEALAKQQHEISQLHARLASQADLGTSLSTSLTAHATLQTRLKESAYTVTKLQQSIEQQKVVEKETKQKHKAMLSGMRSGLLAVEESIRERSSASSKYIKQLKELNTSLTRHLKNGYSNAGSYTGYEMLEKLARVLNGLEECVGKCDSDVSRVASEVTKNATKRSMGEDSNEGRNVMGDICGELEKQNNRLRREVGRLNEENEQLRIEESQRGKLLPEYRLEIVRSRGLAEVAEKSLRAERGAVTQLQRRLDECVQALKSSEEDRVSAQGFAERKEYERNHTKAQVNHPLAAYGIGGELGAPTFSEEPVRQDKQQKMPARTTLSEDELMFTRLLQTSNEKLLSDLQRSVEEKMETVVKRQTDLFLSKELDLNDSDVSTAEI